MQTLIYLSCIIIYTGKSETISEKLKSILAQFEFKYQVQQWESQGVPFNLYLHVPELHPITGCLFCEREDEGHIFKVLIILWAYILYTNIKSAYPSVFKL